LSFQQQYNIQWVFRWSAQRQVDIQYCIAYL